MIRHALRAVIPVLALTIICALPAQADYAAGKRAWDAGRPAEALKEWRAAANAGDRRAMLALGRLFMRGVGAPQNFILAHMWFNLAAGRGEMEAAKKRDALAEKMTPQQIASAQERAHSWRSGGDDRKQATSSPPPRAIREAQELLAALGYKPSPVDGRWNERTAKAYGRFLRDAGLPPGDTLTPSGLRAMRAAAKRQGAKTGARASSRSKVRPDALHRAVLAGNIDGFKAALAAGADVNARDARSWTALMHAANKGYALMVESLIEAKAEVDARAADGATALFMAAAHGHSAVIKLLTKAGADPTIEGPRGRTVEGLTAARVARKKYGGARGLHKALRANEGPAVIKALLDLGADIDARDEIPHEVFTGFLYFYTPLHIAARYNKHPEVIALLLERGANLNDVIPYRSYRYKAVYDPTNKNALHIAATYNENPAVIKILLERGIDVDVRGTELRHTPLMYSAGFNKNLAVSRLLLNRGADVNARNKRGHTPLHRAARWNKIPAASKLLLDRGTDVNARSKDGDTPLHIAARWNKNSAVVKLLLDRGADVKARNDKGEIPLDWAAKHNNDPAIIKMLQDRGAYQAESRSDTSGDPDTPSDNEN